MKKLGFGFMRLPLLDENDVLSVDVDQLCRMVDTFIERGFTYFDTAYVYHKQQSEVFLKKVLSERYPRDRFQLATKLPMPMVNSVEDNEKLFNEELEKCGVEYFDYYLLHAMNAERFEKAKKYNSWEFLKKMKAEGKIRHIGFSFHDDVKLLEEMLTLWPETEFVQLQINYIDWENPSIQAKECYDLCTKLGKPVIVMEPIKGGSLVNIPEDAEKLFRDYAPDASTASWAVRYAASLDNVMMVLSGMSNYSQLDDNTAYMENFVPLNEEEKAIVDKVVDIINSSIAVPCTACGYCVDGCPMGIPIPKYFALYNAELQALNKGFSTQQTYYTNMTVTLPKASRCIGCGACEASCPQHIGIIDGLKLVAERFEK
ncbi:MAG: aldo/keto reductase [Oscillospiraceae bacterium]|nr:aldo/keto reductase [Oscillospiraceae bacterium]